MANNDNDNRARHGYYAATLQLCILSLYFRVARRPVQRSSQIASVSFGPISLRQQHRRSEGGCGERLLLHHHKGGKLTWDPPIRFPSYETAVDVKSSVIAGIEDVFADD